MMIKKLALVCLTCIVAAILVGLTFGFAGRLIHSTESPSQGYKVEITQKRFLIERAVYLNAYKDGEPLVTRKLLYTGDFLDGDFRELYPNYSWLSESALNIGQRVWTDSDALRVVNESQNRINYLLIETWDNKIVLFDVEPGASINLQFLYFGRLSCQGETANSQERFGSAVELISGEESKGQRYFVIRVTENHVSIESPRSKLKQVNCCAADRPDFQHEWSY